VIIQGTVNHGGEEERVLQKSLDGFDEKRREVPCVGEGGGKSPCMFEICIEGWRFLEIVQVFESSWMSCDVLLVRRF